MTIPEPILILGMARSGTSLIASIFKAHGVWVGLSVRPPNPKYPKGFNENRTVKNLLIKHCGRADTLEEIKEVPDWKQKIHSILRKEGYQGGPWLIKHSVLFGKLYLEEFKPHFVFASRSREDILDSIERKGGISTLMTKEYWDKVIIQHEDETAKLYLEQGGVIVDTDVMIKGNYFCIEEALKRCNLESNKSIIESTIVSSVWGRG